MEKLELSELKYPQMRDELIDYLHALADKGYQYLAWVEDKRPQGGHDELDYTIHFLYDDTDLANDPSSLISWILRGDEEAYAISVLIEAIDYLFEQYGTDLKDKEYLEKHEWNKVVGSAKMAIQIFSK